jgi:hypothetical protein
MTRHEIEDTIERAAERRMDRIDRAFIAGEMDQQAYDKAIRELNEWADIQYQKANMS